MKNFFSENRIEDKRRVSENEEEKARKQKMAIEVLKASIEAEEDFNVNNFPELLQKKTKDLPVIKEEFFSFLGHLEKKRGKERII